MNSKTKEAIIKLNTHFYTMVEQSFNQNRKDRNWGGVKKFFEAPYINSKPSVLDIACGNGRVLTLLKEHYCSSFNYTGLDNNIYLLNEAKSLSSSLGLKNTKFRNINVLAESTYPDKDRFDLILALGVTHHIPSSDLRESFFSNIANRLSKNGFAIISFWETKKSNYLLEIPSKEIYRKDLDEGDRFFSWGRKKDIYRYYHYYSSSELKKIVDLFTHNHCILHKKYTQKEFKSNLNKYFIFRKGLC